MLVQEPVQAAIWHCLNHYAYNDAIFLAERLRAEVESEETIWLLATCYYRSGKPAQAYSILKNSNSPQCKFLLAKCCLDLQKMAEAEHVLTSGELNRVRSLDEIATEYGDRAGFALTIIATICFSSERHQKGIEAARKALKVNPFLWTVFEQLCKRGDRPDPTKAFNVSTPENLSKITGTNPVINYVNSQVNFEIPNNGTRESFKSINNSTPVQVFDMGNTCLSGIRAFTPELSPLPFNLPARPKRAIRYRNIFPNNTGTPVTPSFGVIPLDFSNSNDSLSSPINTLSEVNEKIVTKRQLIRKEIPLTQSKYQSSNNTPSAAPTSPSVRRSSRLFTNSYAVKENTKSPSRNKFASPKSPSRKTKSRTPKALSKVNCSELNDKNRVVDTVMETPVITVVGAIREKSAIEQALVLQRQSLEGLMMLLQDLGQAYLYLMQYECKRAVEILNSLPSHHHNTGWVLSLLGKAYFEMNDYKKACNTFSQVRKCEPERCTHMEIYSTALWHLQRESSLSALAQDLVNLDKQSPEAWCAAGNCYSLQKEHDVAIKFFQRAVQVDPSFAYAYTLLGHEYVVTEELEKAMSCFRSAVRLDSRHYNAWYGIGTIYSKQEKLLLSELHYKRALAINPNSCVLMCHIGVVQLALHRKQEALETLDKAMKIEPNNPLCKFHRASILASCSRHTEALDELEQLKELVPKESLVYYLTGKIHKRLGNTHLALMHFSWATDLDPKGTTNQLKEAVDPGVSQSSGAEFLGEESTAEDLLRTPPHENADIRVAENDDSF